MTESDDNQPPSENALQAFETLGQYLEEDGWYPQRLGEKHILRVRYSGKNGDTTGFAQVLLELEQFLFYVVAPVKAPEEGRHAVAEFVTRANYGLRIGNFELDYRDGEVRYKTSLDFEGQPLTPSLIKNAIYPAVQTMDRYLGGLMRVIYGSESPSEVIADIEGN